MVDEARRASECFSFSSLFERGESVDGLFLVMDCRPDNDRNSRTINSAES